LRVVLEAVIDSDK